LRQSAACPPVHGVGRQLQEASEDDPAACPARRFEHQDYTYGTLVRKLGIKRDSRRLPLTEIQFNLERVGKRIELRIAQVLGRAERQGICELRFVFQL